MDTLKELLKQPFWVLTLCVGVLLIAFPSITIGKENHWVTHPPTTMVPVVIGIGLLFVSCTTFAFSLWSNSPRNANTSAGVDLTRVKEEEDGTLWTSVGGCEVRVVQGRIEDYAAEAGVTTVLPCNEYFDDRCVGDTRSALGAYVNRNFEGQVETFVSLMKDTCRRKFGAGSEQQKTDDERGESFGAGRCVLLNKPLGRSVTVALVSTTTQRAGQGLEGRISYLFAGMRELVTRMADARLNDVVMPILGAGHGGIDRPLAFVGLLLAVAEAARYGHGGQCLKRVTIVVFKPDKHKAPEVAPIVVRRALALIGSERN